MVSSGAVAIGTALGFDSWTQALFADSQQPLTLAQRSTARSVQMPGENEPQPILCPGGAAQALRSCFCSCNMGC